MKYNYLPEGAQFKTDFTLQQLEEAYACGSILEAVATLCDSELRLHVPLGCCTGIIPCDECVMPREGMLIKDISVISRVGKSVCFKIMSLRDGEGRLRPLLSRRMAQEECMSEYVGKLKSGDVIDARITHLESFGAFADIGCGIISLMPVDRMSISRISHPSDRFLRGQYIRAVVRTDDELGRISLSHRELLGTWEENASRFQAGQTAFGIIRASESYGVFIELAPNLAGLAEPDESACAGQGAAVYIKSILPDRMKIKLVIVDITGEHGSMRTYTYPDTTHISYWRYSPENCSRVIESSF